MKKVILTAAALLALTSTVAMAGGINMSWQNCGTNGEANRVFACNSSSTTAGSLGRLVLSFVPAQTLPAFVSVQGELELQAETTTFPDYWRLKNETSIGQTGQCRNAALSASTNFAGLLCEVPYINGPATPGLGQYRVGFGGENRARLNFVAAVAPDAAAEVLEGTEYLAMILELDTRRTTGTTVCAGCDVPVCIDLKNLTLLQEGVPPQVLQNPLHQKHVTYQGASDATCAGATPARKATWGAVKSLYR